MYVTHGIIMMGLYCALQEHATPNSRLVHHERHGNYVVAMVCREQQETI